MFSDVVCIALGGGWYKLCSRLKFFLSVFHKLWKVSVQTEWYSLVDGVEVQCGEIFD